MESTGFRMALPAGELFHRALSAMESGKIDVAEALLKETIELQPGHIPALNVLSTFLATRGRLEEAQRYGRIALAAYDQALQKSPALAEAWLGRGQLLIQFSQDRKSV